MKTHRKIALAQHLGLDILTYNETIYLNVKLEDFNEFSGSNYKDTEEIDADNKPFQNWLDENAELLDDEIIEDYDNNFSYGSEEYLVVTDEEAEELWDEELEYYIDELILPDLNERYHNYFDREAWKLDARMDGRGHSLNRYNGSEGEEKVEVNFNEYEKFYIYRQN